MSPRDAAQGEWKDSEQSRRLYYAENLAQLWQFICLRSHDSFIVMSPFLTTPPASPYQLFSQWLQEAENAEPNDPNALALATVGADGMPSVRMVLLKGHDETGFTFYTNRESRKGQQLEGHPKAALCFHWKSLRKQVRVEGDVTRVNDADSDAYFATRVHGSQIGAWASQQSRPLESRAMLIGRAAEFEAKFLGKQVPRPPQWGGYHVAPRLIEFWQDQPFRLHDRVQYERAGDRWTLTRLYP